MRRVFAILLLVIFTVANSGTAISLHYCKGKFSKVELGGGKTCCCKVKAMPRGCCTSRIVVIKVKSEFSKSNVEHGTLQITAPFYDSLITVDAISGRLAAKTNYTKSPPGYSNHVVLNRAFRL